MTHPHKPVKKLTLMSFAGTYELWTEGLHYEIVVPEFLPEPATLSVVSDGKRGQRFRVLGLMAAVGRKAEVVVKFEGKLKKMNTKPIIRILQTK